ncbi:MAG: hypothetical protein ACR2PW_05215 [Gammaproteobacteria bacterium]
MIHLPAPQPVFARRQLLTVMIAIMAMTIALIAPNWAAAQAQNIDRGSTACTDLADVDVSLLHGDESVSTSTDTGIAHFNECRGVDMRYTRNQISAAAADSAALDALYSELETQELNVKNYLTGAYTDYARNLIQLYGHNSGPYGWSATSFDNNTGDFAFLFQDWALGNTISRYRYRTQPLTDTSLYWAYRIGLDPNVAANAHGSIQEQLNWVKQTLVGVGASAGSIDVDDADASSPSATGADTSQQTAVSNLLDSFRRGTAIAAALQDPYIPVARRSAFSIHFATYEQETAMSFGLASIVGTRGRFNFSASMHTQLTKETLYRTGYSIFWY